MKTTCLVITTLVSAISLACGGSDGDSLDATNGGATNDVPLGSGGAAPDPTGATGGNTQESTGGTSANNEPLRPVEASGGTGGGEDPPRPTPVEATGGSRGDVDPEATGGVGGGGGAGDTVFGITVRIPGEQLVSCSESAPEMPQEPMPVPDEDFVCTFAHGDVEGHVYVQATPTDCRMLMGPVPTAYDASGSMEVDGVVSPLEGVLYDHGGNHFNNFVEFDYGGNRYRVTHSSIGFGYRACQPPDCLQVYAADGTTLVEDGCTVDRTLPVACVQVEAGGVVPELEDNFLPCPGDPNFE